MVEKTFVQPALLRPDIEGLRGKGGKAVSLFEEVRIVEEVLKYD